MKFECHITCSVEDALLVERTGLKNNWKFSCINGDALMGAKPHCYLTNYNADAQKLKEDMETMSDLLNFNGVKILRQKIERIIFDTKTGVCEIGEFLGHHAA